jgi:hypothetical protein
MEPHRKLLGTGAALVFVKDKPGRITHEFATDKKMVIAQTIAAMVKAHESLGLKGTDKMEEAAESALKKIMEVYPSAYIADILKALEMASFGQIKIEGQLTNISPANIFNWYKVFRAEHSHLSVNPMKPILNAMPEPTIDEKAKLIRDFFQKGITNPDSIIGGFDSTFRKIIALGLYCVNAQYMEDKFRSEMSRVSFAFKIVSVADQKKKGQLIQLQNHINTVYKDVKIDFKTLQVDENFRDAFILVSDSVKKEIVKEVMKTNTVQSVMKIYDNHEQIR